MRKEKIAFAHRKFMRGARNSMRVYLKHGGKHKDILDTINHHAMRMRVELRIEYNRYIGMTRKRKVLVNNQRANFHFIGSIV